MNVETLIDWLKGFQGNEKIEIIGTEIIIGQNGKIIGQKNCNDSTNDRTNKETEKVFQEQRFSNGTGCS